MNMKKILLIAVAVNLVFLGAYFSLGSLSAAEDKQAQGDVRKPAVQDTRAQTDSLRQREELLRIRQRELDELERRIDEKIRKLSLLETSVKTEIAMYRQMSDERTKHLVKIYSSMKPNAAATLMNQMDIEVATEVFLGMKGEVAGSILSYMEPPKAAAITKRLMSSRKLGPASSQASNQAVPIAEAQPAAQPAALQPETPAAFGQPVKPAPRIAARASSKAWKKTAYKPAPAPVKAEAEQQVAVPQPAVPAPAQTAAQAVQQATVPQPQAAKPAQAPAQAPAGQVAPQPSPAQAPAQAAAQPATAPVVAKVVVQAAPQTPVQAEQK